MAKELTDSNFEEVLASGLPVVIDFGAEWCGPCRKIAPIIDELAEEYEGVIDIRKCDVGENPDVCGKYRVLSVPTVVFLKNGEIVDTHTGTATKKQLVEKIEKLK